MKTSQPKQSISSPALRDLVSSSLKRQNLTATVPGAMRFLPLGALAAGELLERHAGSSILNEILLRGNEADATMAVSGHGVSEVKLGPATAGNGIAGCGTCRLGTGAVQGLVILEPRKGDIEHADARSSMFMSHIPTYWVRRTYTKDRLCSGRRMS